MAPRHWVTSARHFKTAHWPHPQESKCPVKNLQLYFIQIITVSFLSVFYVYVMHSSFSENMTQRLA